MVLEIMAPWPVTIPPDSDVRDATREMLYLEVQRLFVEDEAPLRVMQRRARWLLWSTAPRRYRSRLNETGAPACPGLAVAPAGGGAYGPRGACRAGRPRRSPLPG